MALASGRTRAVRSAPPRPERAPRSLQRARASARPRPPRAWRRARRAPERAPSTPRASRAAGRRVRCASRRTRPAPEEAALWGSAPTVSKRRTAIAAAMAELCGRFRAEEARRGEQPRRNPEAARRAPQRETGGRGRGARADGDAAGRGVGGARGRVDEAAEVAAAGLADSAAPAYQGVHGPGGPTVPPGMPCRFRYHCGLCPCQDQLRASLEEQTVLLSNETQQVTAHCPAARCRTETRLLHRAPSRRHPALAPSTPCFADGAPACRT